MRATRSTYLILLELITLIPNNIFLKRTGYEAPHYAVFSNLPLLPPS